MPKQQTIHDYWLLPILRELIPKAAFDVWVNTVTCSYWGAAVRAGLATDEQILHAIAHRTRLRIADGLSPTPQACERIPERLARQYRVLPLSLSETTIEVATGNPYDLDCEQTLAFASGRRVHLALASPARIAQRIDEVYRPEVSVTKLLAGVRTVYEVESPTDDGNETTPAVGETPSTDRPVIQLVDHIVSEGIAMRASDIHLETEEDGISVRYRVDGVLRQTMLLPKGVGMPLVSRVKIMARMDIADRLRPQGGRARVSINGARIDLRVSTLPAAHGEKVVIRILDTRGAIQSLGDLGTDQHTAVRLRKLLETREGLILVTGPTGSGKTTTLYAALHQLQQRGLNIITVEDPVEYRVPGIVQVQVNEKAGLTFAAALRSILRQDPDVILIGEVRDRETAAIAIQAALTGHLVFATLHTIDACSSIARLHDLGVEPAKVAAALKWVVAQRLVRRLCKACARTSTEAIPPALWNFVPSGAGLREAAGCIECGETGYRGRVAVAEILPVTNDIGKLISSVAPANVVMAAARNTGNRSLWDNAVGLLLDGVTSAEEITRVLEPNDGHMILEQADGANDATSYDVEREYTPYSISDSLVDMSGDTLYHTHDAEQSLPLPSIVTDIAVGVVDVYIIDTAHRPWRVLALQRSEGGSRPGTWECVHGRIDAGERPEQAAVREVREETGLVIQRLYNVTVHPFYLHHSATVQLAVVFCAFVDSNQMVHLGTEHQKYEWLDPDSAAARYTWPRAGQALQEISKLLHSGDAGPAEDVLRVI